MHFSYIDLLTSNTLFPPSSSLPPYLLAGGGERVVELKKAKETVTTPIPVRLYVGLCFSLYHVDVSVLTPHFSSSAFAYEGKSSELAKGSGKHIGEAGASSSAQVEEEGKGSNIIFRQKETTSQPVAESLSHEGCAIRPGMFASNLKFGGCGSCPDLPWVSTTGQGPNGKTISGVTYQYDRNQRKIVCACHGSHMTEEEFIQHASPDASNRENNASLASFPASNPAASAQN